MQAILKMIANVLLLPLLKEGIDYVAKKIKEYQEQKKKEQENRDTVDRGINEQDQREVENEIETGSGGKPSGHGRIVNKLPGVE